jgi:lysophospholipase L1-like esterase
VRTVPLLDGPVSIEGAVDVRRGAGYVRPFRLPVADLDLHHQALVFMASCPAGVRLRLRTDSTTVAFDVEQRFPPPEFETRTPTYDVTIDNEIVASVEVPGERERVVVEGLPAGDNVVEVWLPVFPGVRLVGDVDLDDGASAEPAPDDRTRWLVYGSSISHCMEAHGPARTWPATAARALDRRLTSMGFAGMAHLDPLVARTIARLPLDAITLKLGINIHNGATLRERTFLPMVHGFLDAIREGHPTTPITVVSPILSPTREDDVRSERTNVNGTVEVLVGDLTLRQMRELLRSAVELRQRRGDEHLTYLDGTTLFGIDPADLDLLPDGLHPNGDGYELIGRRYAEAVASGAAR